MYTLFSRQRSQSPEASRRRRHRSRSSSGWSSHDSGNPPPLSPIWKCGHRPVPGSRVRRVCRVFCCPLRPGDAFFGAVKQRTQHQDRIHQV